ncbi:MAG: VTT domain-containing protein, partial [Desulfobacterales bacterium]
AISRTLPAYKSHPAVNEVERLYLDSIAAARHAIYIENQYLSSHRLGQALAQRLAEPKGPEVVIFLPHRMGGGVEDYTRDVLRGRILKKLREADGDNRLRTFYPRLSQDPFSGLMVHAKLMVIDDRFVRVGSSNLSNRSMGLDAECDLALDAEDDEAIRKGIAAFRNRLLGEHLDCSVEEVAEALAAHGALVRAIEALRGKERTLEPLSEELPPEVETWVPESELLDPEKPVEPDELVDYFIHRDQQPFLFRHLIKIIILIVLVLVLAGVWRFTPAGQWLNLESLLAAARWIRGQPMAPLLVLGAFVVGGLAAFPVTLMILAAVGVFGPWEGGLYSMLGAALSALTTFGAGRLAGGGIVRRVAGSRFNRISRRLAHSGLLTTITLRIVPVAPFSLINVVAGVTEIRFKDFLLGTVIGMTPGVTAIALLADRITQSIRQPDPGSLMALTAAIAAVALGLVALRKWIQKRRKKNET